MIDLDPIKILFCFVSCFRHRISLCFFSHMKFVEPCSDRTTTTTVMLEASGLKRSAGDITIVWRGGGTELGAPFMSLLYHPLKRYLFLQSPAFKLLGRQELECVMGAHPIP